MKGLFQCPPGLGASALSGRVGLTCESSGYYKIKMVFFIRYQRIKLFISFR